MTEIASLALSIDSLQATEAETALDGLDKAGKLVFQSAESFTAALKRQADTIGKTATEIRIYEAQQQKLNATQLASVQQSLKAIVAHENQVKVAKQASVEAAKQAAELDRQSKAAKQAAAEADKLAAAQKKSAEEAESVTASYRKLVAILGTGGVVAAAALAARSAINLQDQYVRLSEIAGTTASRMSAFDLSARLSGTSLDTVARSVAMLGRSIGEARLGDVEKQGIFRALGINVDDGRDAALVMVDVAKALTGIKDQNIASVASNALLQRGFAELRPLMKDITEQGTLVARTTDDQAKRAKEFNDQLTMLKVGASDYAISLTNDLLPAMTKVVNEMNRARSEAGAGPFAAIIAGISTFLTGDDQFKNDRELVELVERKLVLENQILAAQQANAVFRGISISKLREQLSDVDAQIRTAQAMRAELSGAAGKGRTPGLTGDGADEAAIAAVIAEERIRQRERDKRLLEARVADIKGFGALYSDAIKVANTLAEEAFKAGGIDNQRTQEELIRQRAANNEAMLQTLAVGFEKERNLYAALSRTKEATEAAKALERVNAQIVANEAITQAQIQSLRTVTAIKQQEEYNAWLIGLEQQGAAIVASFGTEREIEDRAYQEKRQALEAYLAAYRDQITNAHELRERLELEHQARLGNLFAQGALDRLKFDAMTWDMQAKTVAGAVAGITASVTGQSKRMFELNKLAAIADIIVSTSQGVMKAWGQGGWFGYGMAALIAAAGAMNLARVRSTQYGGAGGLAPSISSSAPPGTTPVFPVPGGQQPAPPSSPPVTVIIQGHFIGTQEFMDNVVLPAIRDAIDNRDFIIAGPNSIQAQSLVSA